MKSIRNELSRSMILGVLLVSCLSGLTLFGVARASLVTEFDEVLLTKASALSSVLLGTREVKNLDHMATVMKEFAGGPDAEYVLIVNHEGTILGCTPSLGDRALDLRLPTNRDPLYWNLSLPGGRPGRAIALALPSSSGEPRILVLADDLGGIDDTLHAVIIGTVAAGLVLVFCVLLVVWLATRRALRPLRTLSDRIGTTDTQSLDHHIAATDMPVEILPIAVSFNALLERLDQGFTRERRTTAGIAHELRTPVAELLSTTELALRWPDDAALAQRSLSEARDIAVQMTRIVESLLRLARLDAGSENLEWEPLEIAALLRGAWAPIRAAALQRDVELELNLDPKISITADRHLLAIALGELLSNAALHSPQKSRIDVELTADANAVTLAICNPAPGLTVDDLSFLGEPLWRKDLARSDSSHAGLGLPLVLSISKALGATLSFGLENGNLQARLRIPQQESSALPET